MIMVEFLYNAKRQIIKYLRRKYFQYKNDRYSIAFRKRGKRALYQNGGEQEGFTLVRNTLRYWFADPFLFKFKETTYLFAELYDKKQGKGVLGYAILYQNKCSKFKVCLEEPFHLSYPCIFQRGEDILMVPETRDAGKVFIYKAIRFPDYWERMDIICEKTCVDTTPFLYENKEFFFTTIYDNNEGDNNLSVIDIKTGGIKKLLGSSYKLRSAGNIILERDCMIRPSQDDTVYGNAVIFNLIESFDFDNYIEKPFRIIVPPGCCKSDKYAEVIIYGTDDNVFDGLHTYNINDDYEVIDLRHKRLIMNRG